MDLGRPLALTCLGALVACGDAPPTKVSLTLGPTYDALGVMRRLEDGVPTALSDVYVTFDGLQVSGGRAVGTIGRRGEGSPAPFTAFFDDATGKLDVEQLTAALTSTASEHVDELGGRGDDISPRDGVADEITGYLRTTRGAIVEDGTLLAVGRTDGRPGAPDDTKLTATEDGVGRVHVAGAAGAVKPGAGVEVFRFKLQTRAPDFTLAESRADGSFDVTVAGIREDAFAVRVRTLGVAGEARFLRVTE